MNNCKDCNGSGESNFKWVRCSECRGTGENRDEKREEEPTT